MNEKTARQIAEMKNQTIGVEVEMNSITRQKAAKVAAAYFGTGRYENTASRNGYSTWSAWDADGREWKFQKDVSIAGPDEQKCELVTPILTYGDIETLQELCRQLRHAGAKSDASRGCGVHIHIGAQRHTPQSLRNLANIMSSHKYYIFPYFWIPEETLDLRVRRDHVPYDLWERQGTLMTTEGNVVHYGYIEKFIERLGEKFNIREIAFDRWGAVQMVQNLEGMGFTVVPFGQGFKDMSPPTKELMKLVLEEKIAHGGHPVLRWMMDNIYIRTDPAGNIKADKEKSTEKIDGAIATIMGLDRAIRCGNDTGASVYDSRGLLFI